MPIHANDLETLHDFIVGVMARGSLGANEARAIALAVFGGIIWRSDPETIEIGYHSGDLANVVSWESISGRKYFCVYNRQTSAIEIRDGDPKGLALCSFTNTTSIIEVAEVFSKL